MFLQKKKKNSRIFNTLIYIHTRRKKKQLNSARLESRRSVSGTRFNHHCKRRLISHQTHHSSHTLDQKQPPICVMVVGGKGVEQIYIYINRKTIFQANLHNDVVNGDVDELDEEPNEAHDGETDRCGHGNLLKLYIHSHKTGEEKERNEPYRCVTALSTFHAGYIL